MNKTFRILILISAFLMIAVLYLSFKLSDYQKENEYKEQTIQSLNDKIEELNKEINQFSDELTNCQTSLQSAQNQLLSKKSFSSRSFFKGNLIESYNNIEDAFDACNRKVSDLEDELRRCKNGW
jgi:chromosome segregation ATPase